MESISHQTILGIDPGTRFMGIAVISGTTLREFSVRTLRNGQRPYDLLGQARAHVLRTIQDFKPGLVAIEEPLFYPTKRAALVSAIGQELRARTQELGVAVREIAPRRIREVVVGNPRASKMDVAEILVARHFAELRRVLPKRPARPALTTDREKYWLHAYDALALAVAARPA